MPIDNNISKSTNKTARLKIMRLVDDISSGLETFMSNDEQYKAIFESFKGYCMQQNISCRQAKHSTNQVISRLPNKWYWYEALCLSWIKSSVDTPIYSNLLKWDWSEQAGYMRVKATYNAEYSVAFGTNDTDIHWMIETEFDADVLNQQGVSKCLKYVYAKDKLNKTNLLKLPLSFTVILQVALETGRTGYDGQFKILKRDAQGNWSNYDEKYPLCREFNIDVLSGPGIPVASLNDEKEVKSTQ